MNWTSTVGDGTIGIDLGSPAVDSPTSTCTPRTSRPRPTSQGDGLQPGDGSEAWSSLLPDDRRSFRRRLAVTTGINKRLYMETGFGSSAPGTCCARRAPGTLVQDLPYATDYIYNSVCRPYGSLYILPTAACVRYAHRLQGERRRPGPRTTSGSPSVIAPTSFSCPGTSVTPELRS